MGSIIVHRPVVRLRCEGDSVRKTVASRAEAWFTIILAVAPVLLRGRVEGFMWGRFKTLVLAAVVGSAALVPLFGDPRTTPVTHPLWARMLLRSMEMADAVRISNQASQVFATLAWRDSLSYAADGYLRADGAVVREEAGQLVAVAATSPAELVYPLAVVQPGDYQLRARLFGAPDAPASAELVPLDGEAPLKTFTLIPSTEPTWVFGGSTHLDPDDIAVSIDAEVVRAEDLLQPAREL